MPDGSSVRTEVCRYLVEKKLRELENAQIPIKDWLAGHHAPPPEDALSLKSTPTYDPINQTISWKGLVEWDRERKKVKEPVVIPKDYKVAIIGAGVAGLRTAMLLQAKQIPYKIFEASSRPGGRLYTYHFAEGTKAGKHDYYDIGAMRFPDNDANEETFKLFRELDLRTIPYVFSNDNNVLYFNNIKETAASVKIKRDPFNEGIKKGGIVAEIYLDKEHTDLRGDKVTGLNACFGAAYDPFRKALIDDPKKGWDKLMGYDWASGRSYLAKGMSDPYPLSVVHWMETRGNGTGAFDRAFSEDILESLEFDDPTKDVQWYCLEGGSQVLTKAMLNKLSVPPSYGQRVTAVCKNEPDPSPIEVPLPTKVPLPIKVTVNGREEESFSHVVSAIPFGCLGTIDTDGIEMAYKQRQAIRTLGYGPAVKVAIKFTTRWWQQGNNNQPGGSSYTDRQSRVVVYPSYGIHDDPNDPAVLMVTYNWHQDASRFGALIQNHDWSEDKLDPKRPTPPSEKVLLEQIYGDLAALHNGVTVEWLKAQTMDYHAFGWYHNPYTMGAFAHFAPGQFSTFFPDIVQPAGRGYFHFAGELASTHHAWVAGALDSARRVVDEILNTDFPTMCDAFEQEYGISDGFADVDIAEKMFIRGYFSAELEAAGYY